MDDDQHGSFWIRLYILTMSVPVLLAVLGRMIVDPGAQRVTLVVVVILTVVYLFVGWPTAAQVNRPRGVSPNEHGRGKP